jgi:hypothetical protein
VKALLGEHLIEFTGARQILTDLRDITTDVLVASGGLRAGRAQNAAMASRLRVSLSSGRRAGSTTISTSRESAVESVDEWLADDTMLEV